MMSPHISRERQRESRTEMPFDLGLLISIYEKRNLPKMAYRLWDKHREVADEQNRFHIILAERPK